jgi:hypothetical protein
MELPFNPNALALNQAQDAGAAIRSGNLGEVNKRILYSRMTLAGVVAIAGVTYSLFQQTRVGNPENTNMFESGRMGTNERFIMQGISITLGGTTTLAGAQSFSKEARLSFSLGPDDIEKFRCPLTFLPSPLGWNFGSSLPNSKAATLDDFYRLEGDQTITLHEGQPFNVRIIQGAAAPALAAPDILDLTVCLHGAYIQNIVR